MTTKPKTILRKRVQLGDFPTSVTDQDAGKELSMKSIISKLEKGVMPTLRDGQYLHAIPDMVNYQDVHRLQQESFDFYNQLPTPIKKAMGSDYTKLESFMTNPENYELLKKEGLIVERKEDTHFIKLAEKISQKLDSIATLSNPTNQSPKS